MDFSSVDDFLRQANAAKQKTANSIYEEITPHIEDPDIIGIPPELTKNLEDLFEEYGDECYRQIGLFCIGKWHAIHSQFLEQHYSNNNMAEGLATMNDLSRINTILQLLEQIGSFGGDEEWRKMLKTTVTKAAIKTMEENNISPDVFFGEEK